MIISVHRRDTDNVGDRMSSPALYFHGFDCIREVTRYECELDDTIVVGGGGLIACDYFAAPWRQLVQSHTGPLICWGAGHNSNVVAKPSFNATEFERFRLVGVRDDVDGFNWVPCVSCLHPIFDFTFPTLYERVYYLHGQHVLPGQPNMVNNGDYQKTIEFIASGATVVTTSYHGAYWAQLLGRKVVVVNPFSSKFLGFRHPVQIFNDRRRVHRAAGLRADGALEECRAANLRFATAVSNEVGVQLTPRLHDGDR